MTVESLDRRTPDVPTALPYATPSAGSGSPTVAASVIAGIGLALVVLGGCFLIGVLGCVSSTGNASFGLVMLTIVLYLLAFACFGGALWLLFIGVRRLLGIMRG